MQPEMKQPDCSINFSRWNSACLKWMIEPIGQEADEDLHLSCL